MYTLQHALLDHLEFQRMMELHLTIDKTPHYLAVQKLHLDEAFGLQDSEASYQWLDGVPSYVEIRDGQAMHAEEYTFSAYFNLGHNTESVINHNLILMSTQNGGRYNQDGSAWWLDNYAIQVQDDGASTIILDLNCVVI